MTDIPAPFQPAPPPGAPVSPAAVQRPPRKSAKKAAKVKKPRKAVVKIDPTSGPIIPPAAPRKKRRTGKSPALAAPFGRKKKSGKIGFAEIASALAGLKADESEVLLQCHNALELVGKKSRAKVVAALGKLFT